MSQKHSHQKKKLTAFKQTNTSSIIFTLPVVKILKDALANFDIMLMRNANNPIANMELAQLTFEILKQKLTAMLEQEEWEKVILFDQNEL